MKERKREKEREREREKTNRVNEKVDTEEI